MTPRNMHKALEMAQETVAEAALPDERCTQMTYLSVHRRTTTTRRAHMNRIIRAQIAWLAALAAGLLLAPVTARAEFADPSTGFAIRPPAGFTIQPTTRRQFDVGVGVASASGVPAAAGTSAFVCEAGFKAAATNNDLTMKEINAFVDKPEWRKLIRSTFELVGTVTAERRFTQDGYRGIELQVTPKMGPDAANVRLVVAMIETAKGRTTLLCNTTRSDIGKGLPQFRAIRASMIFPK